ncbi:hypothetical protein TNCV_939581 [Trichonephila clavipes]|nr:hypothetical protein TNCV_939581 [Trichonephila clavipes]
MHTKFAKKQLSWRLGSFPVVQEGFEFRPLRTMSIDHGSHQSRNDGNVQLICDLTNISMSISLDCSVNVRNQLFFHIFVRLTRPWQIPCLLSTITTFSPTSSPWASAHVCHLAPFQC